MGSFFQNKANVVTAGLIILVLLGGGFFLIKSRQGSATPASFVSADTQSLPIGFGAITPTSNVGASNNLISVLSGLRTITLDGSLFQDPSFLGLQDFGIPLQEEPVGRYNPFLPIGVDAVGVAPGDSTNKTGTAGSVPPAIPTH
jgi:hypothetical protein